LRPDGEFPLVINFIMDRWCVIHHFPVRFDKSETARLHEATTKLEAVTGASLMESAGRFVRMREDANGNLALGGFMNDEWFDLSEFFAGSTVSIADRAAGVSYSK
jgi:hypothetical protein